MPKLFRRMREDAEDLENLRSAALESHPKTSGSMNEQCPTGTSTLVVTQEWIAAALSKLTTCKTSLGPDGMTYSIQQNMADNVLLYLRVAVQRRSDGDETAEDHLWDYASTTFIDKRRSA